MPKMTTMILTHFKMSEMTLREKLFFDLLLWEKNLILLVLH